MNGHPQNLNKYFDHSLLNPETDEIGIRRLCQETLQYKFYAVAVNPVWITRCREILSESAVRVVSVAGFPLGANLTEIKVTEAVKSASLGAQEIDMVANIGWLVSNEFEKAANEIKEIRRNLPYNVILKVIIEAGKLSLKQQQDAARAVIDGGAQFVKTGTGFFGWTTLEQVQNIYEIAMNKIEIKASGGIRTLDQCRQMIEAGATRIGSSASVAIMKEWRAESGLSSS